MEHGVVLLSVGGRRGIYLKNLLWIIWMLTAKKNKKLEMQVEYELEQVSWVAL